MPSKVYSISDNEFKQLIANSTTYSECLRKLGLTTRGGSSRDVLKKRIAELNCSTEHFGHYNSNNQSYNTTYTLKQICVENSTYHNIDRLKKRLIQEHKLEYKCAFCGNTGEWYGKKLSLQLDHINGVHNDHRLENLRFLCPNCHSTTETFAGKNK